MLLHIYICNRSTDIVDIEYVGVCNHFKPSANLVGKLSIN